MRRIALVLLAALLGVGVLATAGAQEPTELPPAPPTGLQVDPVGDSGLTVSWQAATSGTAATGYKVRVNPDCGKRKTKTVGADTLSLTFGKVKYCQTYKVWVRATGDAGQSDRLETTWQRPQQGQEQGDIRAGARVRIPERTPATHIYYGGTGNPLDHACLYTITFTIYRSGQNDADPDRTGSWATGACIPNTHYGMYWKALEDYVNNNNRIAGIVFCTSHHKAIEAAQQHPVGGKVSGSDGLASISC